jgi:hypothetical protein
VELTDEQIISSVRDEIFRLRKEGRSIEEASEIAAMDMGDKLLARSAPRR